MCDRETLELLDETSAILLDRNWKLATAESCTGGWIAKVCTDIAGSSAWFERGFVTYSNEAKMEMLGVNAAVLGSNGAVSRLVAEQMAIGAVRHSRAQVSLAVTGVAGPDGGSAEKPVGTVWFAWSGPQRAVDSALREFRGDRREVRRQAVHHALTGLLKYLRQS